MSQVKALIASIGRTLLSWGPWGAFVLAILDSAGIPVPEGVDVLLVTMAAFDTTTGYFGAALSVVGSVIGSIILYYIGRKGGEEFLDKRTQVGWPRRFRRWFHHYGGITIFLPVLIPVPLPVKIFVLSAGALGMNRAHFITLILIARSIRYFGLAYLGAHLGKYPLQYLKTHIPHLLAMTAVLFVASYLVVKWKDRVRARHAHAHPQPENSDDMC